MERKVIEYITVQSNSPYDLQWHVADKLKQGYELCAYPVTHKDLVFQPMVKYSTPAPDEKE